MESNRGLVKDIETSREPGANLGGQPDSLRLAPGKAGRGPRQRQVVEANVDHEPQAGSDLIQDAAGHGLLAIAQLQTLEEANGLGDREAGNFRDVETGDGDSQRLGLEPSAPADGAGPLRPVGFAGDRLGAKPGADGTGSFRRIEREVTRLRLGHAGSVVSADVVLRHRDLPAVHGRQQHRPTPQLRRDLQRVHQPRPVVRIVRHRDPVHHHLDVVPPLAGDRDLLSEVVDPPVDTHPAEALLTDLIQQALVFAPAAPDHGAKDDEPGAFRHLLYPVRHLLDGLLVNLTTTDGAVGKAHAREEEAKVVVDLGHGSHRGARIPGTALLID